MCLRFSITDRLWKNLQSYFVQYKLLAAGGGEACSMVSCVPIFKAHTLHRMTPGDGFMLHFALLKLIGNCLACSASNLESCFVATFFWLPSEKCMGWWKRVCSSLQANFCLLTPALTISSGSTPPKFWWNFA